MRSRRSALTLLVVMIVVAGALSAAERDRTKDKPKTTPPVAAAPAPDTGREVAATLPGRPVRARVGDTVILHVRSAKPDIASMIELGLQTSVGPALPGELRFIAESPGTFPVMLTVAGTTGGVVEVRDAERQ